jgi:tRNA dimethylallyltransferase
VGEAVTTVDRSSPVDGPVVMRLGGCQPGGSSHAAAGAAPPLLVLAGATATGKTGLSIRLAEALEGEGVHVEIVSADSRQVYRGLDIGTAKATAPERARVLHHGLDLVDPDVPFTVVDFARHAETAIAAIDERAARASRPPLALLVGGSGLYLRAVARGLDDRALATDAGVRAALEAELAVAGVGPLADRLLQVAPSLAATTDLHNPRRVVRALEVATLAGDRPRPAFRGYPGPLAWLGLALDPDNHRRWIAGRARAQFDAGLIEEARRLRERFDPALPAFSAIGYREAWSVLDGQRTREEAIADDTARNVAFARRQRTWFRSERDIDWLRGGEGSDLLDAALTAARALLAGRA